MAQSYVLHATEGVQRASVDRLKMGRCFGLQAMAGDYFTEEFFTFLRDQVRRNNMDMAILSTFELEQGLMLLCLHVGKGHSHEALQFQFQLSSVDKVLKILEKAKGWIREIEEIQDFFTRDDIVHRVYEFAQTGLTPIMGTFDFLDHPVPVLGERGRHQIAMLRLLFIRDQPGNCIYVEAFLSLGIELNTVKESKLYQHQLLPGSTYHSLIPSFVCTKPACKLGGYKRVKPVLIGDKCVEPSGELVFPTSSSFERLISVPFPDAFDGNRTVLSGEAIGLNQAYEDVRRPIEATIQEIVRNFKILSYYGDLAHVKEALHPSKFQIDGRSTAVAKQARRLEMKRPLMESYNEMFKVCASLYNIRKRFAPTYNVSPLPRIFCGVQPLPSVRVATALHGLNKESWGQWHMLKCCLPIMVAGGTVKFHACVSLTVREKADRGDCVARMLLGEDEKDDEEKDEEESERKRRMSV